MKRRERTLRGQSRFRGVTPEQASALWAAWSAALAVVPLDLLRFEDLPASFQARVLDEGVRVA